MKKLALLLALILAANPAFAALKGFSQSSTPTLTGPIFTGQASPTYAQGKLTYDTDNESLTFYNNDSNISLQIGQENWVRVINNSGSSIANGSAVKITGASGGLPTIGLIQANASDIALGLITETLADGATGYVTVGGLVRGIDTSAFSAGATLYVSSSLAGGLTATAPSAPNYRMRIGTVGVSNASTGTILVNSPTSGLGFGSANQVLGINSAATAQEYKTLAVGTSGTDFAVAHAANSVTFNLPDASATARGAVTIGTQTFAGAKTFSSTIVGSVNGNAATATTATNATNGTTVAVSNSASYFPLFAASSSNSNQPFNLDTTFTYNPSTDTVTATNFAGNATTSSSTSGNAATATALQNARTIAGVSFNGTANIAIACAGLSNGATGCSTATGTSGATIPLLNGTNTWSAVQTYSAGQIVLGTHVVINQVAIQSFSAGGTYTPTTGMVYAIAELCGSGGGSGGVAATGAATSAAAAGGSAGSYAKVLLTAAQVGASQTITIGAAGAAGTAGANSGGNGNTTSIGTLVSCPGGIGGGGSSAQAAIVISAAPTGANAACTVSTGTSIASLNGGPGEYGIVLSTTSGIGGSGGSTPLGAGGKATATGNAGAAGTGFCSGASGPAFNNAASSAGTAGQGGDLVITEFISQ